MGLLDGFFDPEQFGNGGGLLGRLLALQPQQRRYQPDADLEHAPAAAQAPLPAPPWPHLPNDGPTPFASQPPASDLHLQYQALRPVLGDRKAMLATISPEVRQTLIAQALANPQNLASAGDTCSPGDDPPVVSDASPNPARPGYQ